MIAPRVWKRGFVWMGAVLVVVAGSGVARADVAFRKKPPAADSEAAPTGGEPGAEGEAAKTPYVPQAEDRDFPEAEAIKQQKAADAALARKARAAQLSKGKEDAEPPLYEKWQFWAVTGGIVVGSILAIWAGSAVWHQMQGGDVRGCSSMTYPGGCYGEGR